MTAIKSHFIYLDNSEYPKTKIIFECDAKTILEADILYQTAIGKDPAKQPYIGCRIHPAK